jgi:hypothetical protein
MSEFLTRFNYGELMGFLSVGGAMSIGLVAVIGVVWMELRKTELAAALKHDMLDRGLSADDIRMVLEAGARRCGRFRGRYQVYSPEAERVTRVRPERESILEGLHFGDLESAIKAVRELRRP